MLGAFLFGAGEMMTIHAIGARLGTWQIAFLRSLGHIILLGAILAIRQRRITLRSNNPKIQLLRGACSAAGFWCWALAYARLPLIDATALSYTRGLFMTLLAAAILHEVVTAQRWLGVVLGLTGAALIIRPTFAHPTLIYGVALLAPALNAGMQVATRFAVRLDAIDTTMAWIGGIALVLFSPAMALPWPRPKGDLAILLMLLLFLGPIATYTSLLALRLADVSLLAPFDYSRLIVNTLAAIAFFAELPSLLAWCGMTIIIVGCLVVQSSKSGWAGLIPVPRERRAR